MKKESGTGTGKKAIAGQGNKGDGVHLLLLSLSTAKLEGGHLLSSFFLKRP